MNNFQLKINQKEDKTFVRAEIRETMLNPDPCALQQAPSYSRQESWACDDPGVTGLDAQLSWRACSAPDGRVWFLIVEGKHRSKRAVRLSTADGRCWRKAFSD